MVIKQSVSKDEYFFLVEFEAPYSTQSKTRSLRITPLKNFTIESAKKQLSGHPQLSLQITLVDKRLDDAIAKLQNLLTDFQKLRDISRAPAPATYTAEEINRSDLWKRLIESNVELRSLLRRDDGSFDTNVSYSCSAFILDPPKSLKRRQMKEVKITWKHSPGTPE